MNESSDKDIIEPEVLPPEDEGKQRPRASRSDTVASVRWPQLLQSLLSGLILDMADLLTRVPLIPHGAVLGALVGTYLVRTQNVPKPQRVWWIVSCALYCAMPLTEFYPLATLFLLYRALKTR